MRDLEYLQDIIGQRPVGLLLHGGSVQKLEESIEKYKDCDVCWMGIGLFTLFETYILSKIGKGLDIVFDCATVPHARTPHYEVITRFPRLVPYLWRETNNLWITTHGLIRDSVIPYRPEIVEMLGNKIMLVDSIFPPDEINRWMDVPNSACLAIASALAGGASKVIVFGLDGYDGRLDDGLKFYFKPEEHRKERLSALGRLEDAGINRDTRGFEERFPRILNMYRDLFGNNAPVLNCSKQSVYTVLPKIDYSELKEHLCAHS